MTSNSNKLRSLFLAALMVFSVFAGTVALSGSAAAAANEEVTSQGSQDKGATTSYTITGDLENSGTVETVNVTLEDANLNSVTSGDVSFTGTSSLSVSSIVTDDDTIEITTGTTSVTSGETVTVDISANVDNPSSGGVYDADVRLIDGSDNNIDTLNTDYTIRGSYNNNDLDSPLDSGETFYTGQTVYATGLNPGEDYEIRDVNDDNDGTSTLRKSVQADGTGEIVFTFDGSAASGEFLVENEDGDIVQFNDDGSKAAANAPSSSNVPNYDFESVAQGISAEFDDPDVGNEGSDAEVDFTIDSDVRNSYGVNISSDTYDADELESIFGSSVVDNTDTDEEIVTIYDAEGTYTLDFADRDVATDADIQVNTTDAEASDSDTINVQETGDEEATIAESSITETRGNVAEFQINLQNADTATVGIGDYDDDNYNLTVTVDDGDDNGNVTLLFNTYSAGAVDVGSNYDTSDNDLIGGVIQVDDDDDEILSARENGSHSQNAGDAQASDVENAGSPASGKSNFAVGEDVLDPVDYEIIAEAGEQIYVSDEDDVATLTLEQRSTDNVQFWTVPDDKFSDLTDSDNEDEVENIESAVSSGYLTQSDTVAGDDITDGGVISIEAGGFEGLFEYHQDAVGGDLGYNEIFGTLSSYEADSVYDGSTYISPGTGGDAAAPFSLALENSNAGSNADEDTEYVRSTTTGLEATGGNYIDDQHEVAYDAENDTTYVMFDDTVDTLNADDGDQFEANFSMSDSDEKGLTDDSVTLTDSFTAEDATATLNDGDSLELANAAGQTVSGETNVAPGTEGLVQLQSEQTSVPFYERPEFNVSSDGSFTATTDLSGFEAGTNFTAQTSIRGTDLGDSIDGQLIEGSAPTTPDTDTEEEETEDGTSEDTAESTEDTAEEMTGTEGMTEEMTGGEGTEEETTGGSGPGFTAAIALIALVAAALLAVRRDN